VSSYGVGQELHGVSALHDAGAGDSEQAGSDDFSLAALVSKRALAPDHRMPQSALRTASAGVQPEPRDAQAAGLYRARHGRQSIAS